MSDSVIVDDRLVSIYEDAGAHLWHLTQWTLPDLNQVADYIFPSGSDPHVFEDLSITSATGRLYGSSGNGRWLLYMGYHDTFSYWPTGSDRLKHR